MSVTSGFFNSIDGDRKYNAEQMSAIFDGVINDGIFASVGTAFVVTASGVGNEITVGKGRAWFNSTWIYNDSELTITLDDSDIITDRIDTVVIEVNHSDDVRAGTIKVIKGEPSTSPTSADLQNWGNVYQYPLAYIYIANNTDEITQADITNCIGTDTTPFVTGILEVISLDTLLGQWEAELDQFVDKETTDFNEWFLEKQNEMNIYLLQMREWIAGRENEFTEWREGQETAFSEWSEAEKAWFASQEDEFTTWSENEKAAMLEWFEYMKDKLSENAAVSLQTQIDDTNAELDKSEIERILMIGLLDGEKVFSDDGHIITSTDSEGRTLTKTFSSDFSTCTSVLTDSEGVTLGTLVKEFSADGMSINTTVTIE